MIFKSRSFGMCTHVGVGVLVVKVSFSHAKYIFRLRTERQNKCCIHINLPRVMTLKSLFDLQGLVN